MHFFAWQFGYTRWSWVITAMVVLLASFWFVSEVQALGVSYKEGTNQKCETVADQAAANTRCAQLFPPNPPADAPASGLTGPCTIIPSCPQEVLTIPLDNPLSASTLDIEKIIGTTLGRLFGVIGSLTLVVFLYGGFMWLTSAGDSAKVKKGTQAMIYAVIGIFIIFGSYAILNLLFTQLLKP